MKILVPVKRVIDYNVKARVRADGSPPDAVAPCYPMLFRHLPIFVGAGRLGVQSLA